LPGPELSQNAGVISLSRGGKMNRNESGSGRAEAAWRMTSMRCRVPRSLPPQHGNVQADGQQQEEEVDVGQAKRSA
jgi:hypothetical protein